MTPELKAIADFIRDCMPFDELPGQEIETIVSAIEIAYYRKGHIFDDPNDNAGLRIVRSGAAELRGSDDRLIDRFGEGLSFNLRGLHDEDPSIRAVLIEDSLIYILPEQDYQALRLRQRQIDRFFHSQRHRRMRRAGRIEENPSDMMRQISDLMCEAVVTVAPSDTIHQTAQLMNQHRVSSVLVKEGENLVGIVTDRDIRSRVVALLRDMNDPVGDIMTQNPRTIEQDATLFDTTLLMTRTGIHHLPVMSGGSLKGIVTASDMILARRDDPIFLVQHISRQENIEGVREITGLLPDLLVQWLNAGIRAHQVSHILTAISDAVTARLIELVIADIGPAPVPFCWLGFGSQARGEQLLGADQDNGLLISNDMKEEHKPWFKQLAQRVCDGLNACGYVYCPGEVMATTDSWRQPLKVWRKTVDKWVAEPTKDALMRVSIFFDLRSIYGDEHLCKKLQKHMLKKVSGQSLFFAMLAANVLDTPPPLSIFRNFVVDRNGEHKDEFNIKKSGLMSIVDIVRLHSLNHGVQAVNTLERLKKLSDCKALSIKDSRNLQDAYRIITQTRLQAQVRQIGRSEPVSNWLNPDDLSKMVRKQLRDAFTIVTDAQSSVKVRYRQGMG